MKTSVLLSIAIILLLTACTPSRYVLQDKNKDRNFLVKKIREESKKGTITSRPILVIDGIPHRYEEELQEKPLQFSKADIKQVDVLKPGTAERIYGERGKVGVVLITLKSPEAQPEVEKPKQKPNVVVFLDDKEIPYDDIEKLDTSLIESIDVIKDKESVSKYTDRVVDGVIVIHTKTKKSTE